MATLGGGDSKNATDMDRWLTEGLGDEDSPPSVFGLLAFVSRTNENSETTSSEDPACALMTLAWEREAARVLRVEWMSVPDTELSSLIKRRIILRLSALCMLIDAHLCIM